MCRAATRYTPDQYPIFLRHTKVPGVMPANMDYLAAWTVLRPPLPSLSANCCKARRFKLRVRNVRRLQLLFFCGLTR